VIRGHPLLLAAMSVSALLAAAGLVLVFFGQPNGSATKTDAAAIGGPFTLVDDT
jgi:hypothetical protein